MKKTKLFHKILAFTLILSILFSMFVFGPVTLSATADEGNTNTEGIEPWKGETAESFADGDGSAGNPFLIENGAQLHKMIVEYSTQTASEGKYFKITKDIYLNDVANGTPVKNLAEKNNWLAGYEDGSIATPSKANSFYGTLDGDGHTIYGLYAYAENKALGLFPSITNGTVIKNLNITNAFIHGNRSYGGAFAGVAIYYDFNYRAQLTNCSVTNTVVGQDELMQFAAGFVGDAQNVKFTFTDCYAYDNTFSDWYGGAGIVANDWNSGDIKINNCYSVGAYPVMPDIPLPNDGRAGINKAVVTNTYTTVAAPEGNVTANITILDEDQMKGEDAKTNMPGLSYRFVWETVKNGYPVINLRDGLWDGSYVTDFTSFEGNGDETSPYLIKNGAQLAFAMVMNSNLNAGTHYKLANDIVLNDTAVAGWENVSPKPWLHQTANRWIGTLDGDGHTIEGLYMNTSTKRPGLVSYSQGTFKNINFTGASITYTSTDQPGVAIVAAQTSGPTNFENIYIDETCKITSTAVQGVAAIAGRGYDKTGIVNIKNCAVLATINATGTQCGAIAGSFWETKNGATVTIQNCFSSTNLPLLGGSDAITNPGNNYSVVEDTNGTNVLESTDLMKGDNAKTYMPGLSYRFVWETVDGGYPVINLRDGLWDGSNGYVVSSYDDFDGEGTKESPYLIENGDQLYYAAIGCGAGACDAKYYKLTKDIILNDTTAKNWEATANPWGVNTAERFNGTLDGDGHTIEGLYINVSLKDGRYGLFSYIGLQNSDASADKTKIAEIKNLNFVGASVTNAYASSGAEGVGIVAGQSSGKAAIENIYIDKTSKASGPNVSGVAGIVGRVVQTVTINNCAVLGTFTGKSAVGSFLGLSKGGSPSISNSYSAANVPVTVSCKPTLKNTYATVKSDTADYDGNVVLVTDEQITGDAAKINMPGLVFGAVWETVKGDYPVIVKNPIEAWDGTAAEEFADGSGTAEDPFLIENGGQLYKMVKDYSNMNVARKPADQDIEQPHFRITKDINLGNMQWYTHSNYSGQLTNANFKTGFNGVIEGDGHTIYGLFVAGTDAYSSVGLIPIATQGAQIYNLHLNYGNLSQTNWNGRAVGAFIGLAVGYPSSKSIIIDRCSVENFNIKSQFGSAGLVGYIYAQSVSITNSYCKNTNLSITGTENANAGAFIAIARGNSVGNKVLIENCYSDDVSSTIKYLDGGMDTVTSFNNVYTLDSLYDGTSVAGLNKVTATQLQGANAKETLPGFNFNQVWVCGEEGEYPVHKAYDSTVWNGRAAASYAGGDGTAESPYEIATPGQLYKLAIADTESTKGKYYKLTADITISNIYDGWANDNPYTWAKKTAYLTGFTYSNSFAGTFDGDGHTVTGLYVAENITNGGTYAYGLIPFISANAVVKNVNIDKVKIDVNGNAYVGAVVGAAYSKGDDATNPLANAQIVGANITNGDITINGVKTDDIIIGDSDGGVKVELCNNQNKYENVISYNASNLDEEAVLDIRNKLLGKNNAYITDINAKEGFNVCDLLCAKKALLPKDDNNSDKYELVWSQDFNGSELDYSVWSRNTTMSRGTTIQYGDLNNVNGESLTLYCEDANTTNDSGNKVYNVNYGLDTMNSMSFKYGRLEMRAKIPVGAGAFPSLWLSSRGAIGDTPDCEFSTEIDVFEVFGETKDESTAISNIHKWYNDENGNKVLGSDSKPVECSLGSGITAGNLSKVDESKRSTEISYEWCTVVFEWTEDTMTFSIDEYDYEFSISRSEMNHFDLTGFSTNSDGVFNQFMYPIITNHMYTTGDGAAHKYLDNASDIDSNLTNLTFEIDYIRLYQKNDGKSKINLK